MNLIKTLAAKVTASFGLLSPVAARSTDFLVPSVFHLPLSPNLYSPFLRSRPSEFGSAGPNLVPKGPLP